MCCGGKVTVGGVSGGVEMEMREEGQCGSTGCGSTGSTGYGGDAVMGVGKYEEVGPGVTCVVGVGM